MSLFINNGLSGLLASQRALQTISNNVANVNTEGYVRQQTSFVSGPVQFQGGFGIGTGVRVNDVERIYDAFLGSEVKLATMAQSRAQGYNDMAMRLDGLLGNPDLNISTSIQKFFDQLEAVNRDPTSIVNREQMLAEGRALEARFQQIDSQLAGIGNEIDNRLQMSVNAANDIAASLAEINNRIASTSGGTPNDLLDQQERLLTQLAEQVDFTQLRQDNGMTNIMVASGQPLVLGSQSFRLAVTPNEFDASKLELAYDNGNGLQSISSRIAGGAIAGMLGFRNEALATAGRELGQIALGLAETVNMQNRAGADLNGQSGGDFFASPMPFSVASSRNTGSGGVSLSYGDVSAINAKDYELLYDGSNWRLTDAVTGGSVTMSGSGTAVDPFVAEGMEIVISAGAATGDRFLLQPVARAAGSFSMEMSEPVKIAVAAMLTTSSDLGNVSDASVSSAVVNDPTAPGLTQPARIIFADSTTFRIYDAGGTAISGSLAYTSGADINFNGWTVQITGPTVIGDEFSIAPSGAGSGDNSNGVTMAKLPSSGYFSNGRLSVEGLGAAMLTSIGSAAARSGQDLIVQNSLLGQAEFDLQSVSGVNLEEEAANLLRYQEAYLASSKIVGIANDLFQTLLATVRR